MHNFNTSPQKGIAALHAQLLSLEKQVSQDIYQYPVPLMDMADALRAFSPAFYVGSVTPTAMPPYWELPKVAGNVGLQFYIPRNPTWINGRLQLYVHYCMDSSVSGNVMWEVAGHALTDGLVIPTRTFGTITRAAPSTAYVVDIITPVVTSGSVGYVAVNNSHCGVVFEVGRRAGNAADTHTGDVRIIKVVAEYTEANRETGSKF